MESGGAGYLVVEPAAAAEPGGDEGEEDPRWGQVVDRLAAAFDHSHPGYQRPCHGLRQLADDVEHLLVPQARPTAILGKIRSSVDGIMIREGGVNRTKIQKGLQGRVAVPEEELGQHHSRGRRVDADLGPPAFLEQ